MGEPLIYWAVLVVAVDRLPGDRPALVRARPRADVPRGRHLVDRLARAVAARGGAGLLLLGSQEAVEYTTVYLIERSLSLDNLFVFLLLFTYFGIPSEYRARLLFWGIIGALVLRLAAIAGGVALLNQFHFVIYILAAALLSWRCGSSAASASRSIPTRT